MSISDGDLKKLSNMIKETGEAIAEQSYITVLVFLCDVALSESENRVPLRLWKAVAQALADSSSYRIVLQGCVDEPVGGEPGSYRTVGYRDVLSAESNVYHMPADPQPDEW